MTMTFSGDGTITGLTAGGLPNATVTNDDLSLSANASNVMTALNASGSAPIYACRAWVNFNGTGTVAIRASGNVSSITDNGTGDYTVNFATAMPDANYTVTFAGGLKTIAWGLPIFIGQSGAGTSNSHSTTAVRIGVTAPNDVLGDSAMINVAVFR